MKSLIDYSSRFRILKGGKISLVVSAYLGAATLTFAAPSGGTVTSGGATISQNGTVTNIDQSSVKASINWQTFNVASGESVNFNQPNSSSITLNRVVGNESSLINGALNANGQVWVLNSNGVLFGKDASINTSGLVATTAKLSDQDFQDGNYNFKDATSNSVVNKGTINIANNGSVVLASNKIINEGTIQAVKGKVHLVGADSYSINLNGNSLVNLTVDKGVLDALVKNSGHIVADGGEIYLTTNAVDELLKGVVNNTGVIEANSVDDLLGHVELFAHGGEAQISGEIKAEGFGTQDGGFIETSGKEISINEKTIISTKSLNGKTGTWLIDPTDINIVDGGADGIAGSNIDASTVETSLSSNSIILEADNDITISESINSSSANSLTFKAKGSITQNASVDVTTNGGDIIYWSDSDNDSNGQIKVGSNISTNGGDLTFGSSTGGSDLNLLSAFQAFKTDGGAIHFHGAVNSDSTVDASLFLNAGSGDITFDADVGITKSLKVLDITANTITQNNNMNISSFLNLNLASNSTISGVISGTGALNISSGKTLISDYFNDTNINDAVGFLTTSPQTIATGTTVETVLDNLSGARMNGGAIANKDSLPPAEIYHKSYDSTNKVGTFQVKVYEGTGSDDYTKTVFVKLTQSGSDVQVQAYQGNGSSYSGYMTGNHLGTDFTTASISNYPLVSDPSADGYGVDQFYVKQSSATVTLTADNTYTGGTIVSGNLVIGSASNTNDVNLNSTLDIDGQLTINAASINVNDVVTVGADGEINLNYTDDLIMKRDDSTNIFTGKIDLNSQSDVNINGETYSVVSASDISENDALINLMNGTTANDETVRYVLGADINIANFGTAGFIPIGAANGHKFKGIFDGFGHVIDKLYIKNRNNSYNGLFYQASETALIQNLGLTNIDYSNNTSLDTGAIVGHAGVYEKDGFMLKNSFATGNITATELTNGHGIGGLVGGLQHGEVHNSYANVKVTHQGTNDGSVGGLVGHIEYRGKIESSYAKGDVEGGFTAGGLLGESNDASYIYRGDIFVTNSYATGIVTNTGSSGGNYHLNATGGLIGKAFANTVSSSYATGNVISSAGPTGGLIGKLNADSSVDTSYSTGNVSLDASWISGYRSYDHDYVGGFVGYVEDPSWEAIKNSYATGDVTGTSADSVAGFVGTTYIASIDDSYSTGTVTNGGNSSNVNPFIGKKESPGDTVSNSFWDVQTSGIGSSGDNNFGATGKTTAEMREYATFSSAGWTIELDENLAQNQYPVLVTENGTTGWRIYGTFIPVSYTLTDIGTGNYTYDATSQAPSEWTAATIFGGSHDDWALGTDYYFSYGSSDYSGFTDANTYNNITVNVVKNGYDETALGSTAGSLVIDKKDITGITGITASNKTYNRSTAATLTSSSASFAGMINGDTLNVATSTGTFENKNVGTGKIVNISGLTLGGTDAGNYNLTNEAATTTANITAKELIGSSIASVTTTYGTPKATGVGSYSGVESGDSVTVTSSVLPPHDSFSTSGNLKAGTYHQIFSLSGDDAVNYTINYLEADSYVVNPLAIAGTIASSSSVYGDDPTANYNSVVFSNVISGDIVSTNGLGLTNSTTHNDTASTNNTASKFDVGNYKVALSSLTGSDSQNYVVHDNSNYHITGDHEITKKALNISGLSADNKEYDSDAVAALSGTASLTGNYAGDTVSILGTASGAFADENADTGKTVSVSGLSLTGASKGNYSLNPISLSADITKKPLTFTSIDAVTTTYGTQKDTGTVNFSGVEAGDTVTAEAVLALDTYSSSNNLNVGTYSQLVTSLGGPDAGNYTIVGAQPNSYVVSPLAIAGTMANSSTAYGDSLSFGGVTFTNAIAGDDVKVNTQFLANSNAYGDSATTNGSGHFDVGNYKVALSSLTGSDYQNYVVHDGLKYYISGLHETTKRPLTINVSNINKIEGELDPTLTYSANLASGETLSGSATREAGEAVGSYAITKGTLLASSNYTITAFNGGTFTIKAAPNDELDDVITPIINTVLTTIPRPPKVAISPTPMINAAPTPVVTNVVNPSGNKKTGTTPTNLVTLSQVSTPTGGGGNPQVATNEFRVPAFSGSNMMLVNGGLSLPTGLEQMVFTPESN